MGTLKIPEGYQRVMPYLIVKDAAAFLAFMKNVFGAEERMRDMRDEQVIRHAEITIGGSIIMCADATDQWGVNTAGLFVYVEDADAAYRKAIEAGAVSVMEPVDQNYGRSGGVTDPFGNTWWITSPL